MTNRILLANRPSLLREIFKHALQRYPDVEIVGEISNSDDISNQIKESQADWVLVPLLSDGKFPDFVNLILENYPGIGILAISADGSQAKARCGDDSRDDLANLSFKELVNLLWFIRRRYVLNYGRPQYRANGMREIEKENE